MPPPAFRTDGRLTLPWDYFTFVRDPGKIPSQIRAGGMRWLDPKGVPADTVPEIRASALMNDSGALALFAGAPKT